MWSAFSRVADCSNILTVLVWSVQFDHQVWILQDLLDFATKLHRETVGVKRSCYWTDHVLAGTVREACRRKTLAQH